MKPSIQRNLLKIAVILGTITALPTSTALADSVYDGIWEIPDGINILAPYQKKYFSIVIKDNIVVIMDLNAMAFYKNPLSGTYFGSLPDNIKLISPPSSGNPLSIRVALDSEIFKLTKLDAIYKYMRIEFTSQNVAYFGPSSKDYPNTDFLPPPTLRKIF